MREKWFAFSPRSAVPLALRRVRPGDDGAPARPLQPAHRLHPRGRGARSATTRARRARTSSCRSARAFGPIVAGPEGATMFEVMLGDPRSWGDEPEAFERALAEHGAEALPDPPLEFPDVARRPAPALGRRRERSTTRSRRHLRRFARDGAGRPVDRRGSTAPCATRRRRCGPTRDRAGYSFHAPGCRPRRCAGAWGAGRSGEELKEHLEHAGYESARPSGWDPAERLEGPGRRRRRTPRCCYGTLGMRLFRDGRRRAPAGVLPRLQRLAGRVLRLRPRPAARPGPDQPLGRRRGRRRARAVRRPRA